MHIKSPQTRSVGFFCAHGSATQTDGLRSTYPPQINPDRLFNRNLVTKLKYVR